MSVPEPDGLPVVGHTLSMFRDPFGFFERAGELGDVVRTEVMGADVYQVRHPDDVQRVLVDETDRVRKPDLLRRTSGQLAPEGIVFTDGEQWRRQRTALQPAFYRERVEGYAPTMVECAREVADRWRDGGTVAVDEAMRELTLRVLSRTMFGVDDPDRRAVVAEVAEAVDDKFEVGLAAFVPSWVPTPTNRRYRRAVAELDDVVDSLLAEVDPTAGDGPPDLLTVMATSDALSTAEVRDQLLTFLFAGHETTSLALTYLWYLLGRHPEVRERLHAEVDALDGDPTAADLGSLTVTDRVVSEALRLYPPVYATNRQTVAPLELGGHVVPGGATLTLPQYFVHRDDRFWDDPATFDPARWRDGPDHEYAYFPFGAGPRHCIGMRFATVELTLVVATLARRWRLEPLVDDLDLRMSMTLQPTHPVECRVAER